MPAPGFGVPSDPFSSLVWHRSLAAVVAGVVVATAVVAGRLVVEEAAVVVDVTAPVVEVAALVVVRATVVVVAAVVLVVATTAGALLSDPHAASPITAVASPASHASLRTAVV